MFLLSDRIKKLQNEKKILLHNQKKRSYENGVGTVYILQPINSLPKDPKKIGNSSKFKSRVITYNTSFPDDMEVKYLMKVNNPKIVETCIKSVPSCGVAPSQTKKYFVWEGGIVSIYL